MNVTDIKGTAGVTNIERAKAKGTDDFKGLFSGMVQEKLDSITETLEEMNARRQEVKELRDQQHFTETVRHVMPDGNGLRRIEKLLYDAAEAAINKTLDKRKD